MQLLAYEYVQFILVKFSPVVGEKLKLLKGRVEGASLRNPLFTSPELRTLTSKIYTLFGDHLDIPFDKPSATSIIFP